MASYRYEGEESALVPDLNLIVKPGDVVEADWINNACFVLVSGEPTKPEAPAAPALADAFLGALHEPASPTPTPPVEPAPEPSPAVSASAS